MSDKIVSAILYSNKDSRLYNPKFRIIWLTLGMIVASVPGFLWAPYSINYFDEPYQILNAFDWENAVYSPLSSYFAHIFGCIFGWKYLNFRYLHLILLFLSIYIPSLYCCKYNKSIKLLILVSSFSLYFATGFKSDLNIYGWDSWTFLFVSISIVTFCNFFNHPSLLKIISLGFISALTALIRLPNISIWPILVILILSALFIKRVPSKILWLYLTVFISTAVFISVLNIILLYGSISNYIELINRFPVGAHSLQEVVSQWLLTFFFVLRYFLVILVLYGIIGFTNNQKYLKSLKYVIYSVVTILFFLSLIPLRRTSMGNVIEASIGLSLLGIGILMWRALKLKDKRTLMFALALFLLSIIPSIGSNWGFIKYLAWPVIPIIFTYLSTHISRAMKIFAIVYGVALSGFSIYAFQRPTFSDDNLNKLTFKLNCGVLEGMYTTPEKGMHIQKAYEDAMNWIGKGYEPIVLKPGNDYLWEYLFLKPNLLQKHRFNEWFAFNNQEYIEAIIKRAKREHGAMVMYMQWKEEDNPTKMWKQLNKEFTCVLDKEGYSFYIVE